MADRNADEPPLCYLQQLDQVLSIKIWASFDFEFHAFGTTQGKICHGRKDELVDSRNRMPRKCFGFQVGNGAQDGRVGRPPLSCLGSPQPKVCSSKKGI